MVLSNGMASPVFKAGDENDQNMQSLAISDYSLVKRVNGTKQGNNYAVRCLMFSKKDGTQLAKVETEFGKGYDTDFTIEDSEEIIGIYGKDYSEAIGQLGFLIWTPPQF